MTAIFIADDDPSIVDVTRILLEGMGYSVVGTAFNGKAAIDAIKKLAKKPDIVIMDYRMPILDGFEASLELKRETSISYIILATADEDVKSKASELEGFKVINKPYDFEKLIDVLKSCE